MSAKFKKWSPITFFAATGAAVAVGCFTPGSAGALDMSERPSNAAVANTVKVMIPMHAVAKPTPGAPSPNVVAPGNCGTAFLYVSRVSYDEAHIDYGFEYLSSSSIFVNASAGMVNRDGPGTANDSYAQPQAYSDSWERQTNLISDGGSGTYQVTAYVHSTGVLYDCVSDSRLAEDIYLY